MNILFVGPYKQIDEWGRKSRALLDALKRTGNRITSRPIYFVSQGWTYNEEAEFSTSESYDAVIQFTLPAFAVYDGRCKRNIGFFNTDTIDTSPLSTAISRMKLLDEVWVENKDIYQNLKNKVGDTRVSLLKPYMDTSLEREVATGRYAQGIMAKEGPMQHKFIFYAIGSLEERDGAKELVCAYASEFSVSDNCVLVYILENPLDPDKVNQFVEKCHISIGATKAKEQRPFIHFMNPDSPLPTEARLVMHKEGDCFICPDYSLNCNTLTLEAIAAQSTPLINKNTAAYELLGESNSWGIESYEDSCILDHRSFDDMFTAHEMCVKPTIRSLSHNMREAYTNKFLRERKRANNIEARQTIQSNAYYDSLKELLCS
jgi:hypothetical protein